MRVPGGHFIFTTKLGSDQESKSSWAFSPLASEMVFDCGATGVPVPSLRRHLAVTV